MGVPGFFASLYSKYKNTNFVFSKLDLVGEKSSNSNSKINYDIQSIDELYLDTNCLIHPVCFRVAAENQSLIITNPTRLEEKMIKEVILYIEHIIQYTNPSKLVYIAIDGVAPMAKIKHQRLRRFKSVLDNSIKANIYSKHGQEFPVPWNNSAITPGTEFMEKLTRAIINWLNAKKRASGKNNVKYIFSSANTPGEGEHKILQHIRANISSDVSRIVYGLDADLLYLSLASQAQRIYLLREITEFQNIKSSDAFCFVSIDLMRSCVFETMVENLGYDGLEESVSFAHMDKFRTELIQDYVGLGFFLGNDFLPGLPSVNLTITGKGLNGLDIILSAYKEAFGTINSGNKNGVNYTFLFNKTSDQITINYNFLLELFSILNGQEEMYWRDRAKYRRYIPPCDSTEPHKVEIHRMENLMFKIPDLFELGKEGVELIESKRRYYAHYYSSDYTDVKQTIKEYFKGMYWNAYYYFDKCPDYTFFFNHHRLPFVSDIFEWLLQSKQEFEDFKFKFPKLNDHSKLIHPIHQLFMVLPVQSAWLLPPGFKPLMLSKSMEEYFPKVPKQDVQLINKYWQALPDIKIMNPYFSWEKIKTIKLSDKEESRNKFKKPYELMI
jgi:5'-3' exonuclease